MIQPTVVKKTIPPATLKCVYSVIWKQHPTNRPVVAADRGQAVDQKVIGQQLQTRLQQAIDTLPDDQREVFLMREQADLSFKEIAEVVGISENTVKSRMRYALEKLRTQLEEYQDMARALP